MNRSPQNTDGSLLPEQGEVVPVVRTRLPNFTPPLRIMKTRFLISLPLILATAFSAPFLASAASLDQAGLLWSPCLEWELENPGHTGNPFDLEATAIFTHAVTGERRATPMFHAGGDTWKFRFAGTRTGVWTFVTRSPARSLDGKQGTVTIRNAAENGLSFTDITLDAGTGGPTGPETGGHGVAFADTTGSGLPDLYITMNWNRPMPDLFFRNAGGNRFTHESLPSGLCQAADGGTHGFCFADLDNNGVYDAFRGITFSQSSVTSSGFNQIKQNDGRGTFTDRTPAALLARSEFTRGVLAVDFNKDGFLDLFAVSGPWGSDDPPGERNEAFLNRGQFEFVAASSPVLLEVAAGQGAIDTDFNGDGAVDIIAANRTGDLHILENDGLGHFKRILPESIGLRHLAKDGVSAADVNNDGHLDLLLAGAGYGELYLNTGGGKFRHHRSFQNSAGYMGGFADLDNDGDVDLVFAGDDKCYLNDGAGNFLEGPAIPVAGIQDPRAIAFADIDNDGDLDFAVAAKRSRNYLIRNNVNSGNWLKIKLISPQGQAGAFGAKTRISIRGTGGASSLGIRESRSNQGYLAQDDPVLHFGLGQQSSADVVVQFLDGTVATRTSVAANQTLTIDGRDPSANAAPSAASNRAVPAPRGFVTSAEGNRWAWQTGENGETQPFIPQIVMARDLPAYSDTAKIDQDIRTWFVEHGFNGLHVGVLCRWFDFDKVSSDQIDSDNPNPDPRTFEVLEQLITRVHRAGGLLHIWAWGDDSRRMTPTRWGINGAVDKRLQRYIAARLGPLPGWTMSYGFDLWEWTDGPQLAEWHSYLHRHMGWPHLLGGRWENNKLTQATEVLDYSSYESLRPTYEDYVRAIEMRPGKPSFAEDRFRVRDPSPYPDKDYDLDMTRRGLWHSTMAGGVANIWGFLVPSADEGASRPYPNRPQIQTYARFFQNRFVHSLERANQWTDGVALVRNSDPVLCLFYKEETRAIRLDLSALKTAARAIAVDTKAPYVELELGLLEPKDQTWSAPQVSDWAIAVEGGQE